VKNLLPSNDVLATPVWRFPKELRFGGHYRYRLQESLVPIYFGANCQGFSFEEVDGVYLLADFTSKMILVLTLR